MVGAARSASTPQIGKLLSEYDKRGVLGRYGGPHGEKLHAAAAAAVSDQSLPARRVRRTSGQRMGGLTVRPPRGSEPLPEF